MKKLFFLITALIFLTQSCNKDGFKSRYTRAYGTVTDSESDKLHLHTGTYINNLITEDWSEDDYKKNADKDARNTDAKHFESAKHPEITIYPNPASGIFNVYVETVRQAVSLNSDNKQNIQLIITDLTGKIVYLKEKNSNNFTVNINDRPNGIYILKILYDNKIISRKIIKQ